MEKFFRFKESNTNLRTEIFAGITTFMTMAYILFVNPSMLAQTGMNQNGVFVATALSAAIATLVMGLYAKHPFALAPGMGLNAFFTYTVVMDYGFTWNEALFIVLVEGIVFILLSFVKVREVIFNSIPRDLKEAISVGIGFFIALIGLVNSGIVVGDKGTIVGLGNLHDKTVLLAVIGILITIVLVAKNIKGALLIGIVTTTVIGIPLGVTTIPEGFSPISMPTGLSEVAFKVQVPKDVLGATFLISCFTFLFLDMFDTVGTLAGVAAKSNLLDEEGNLPRVERALLADAIGTTVGALFGTSTVTTFVESSAGVADGGRTGLTAVTTAVLFIISIVLSPLFGLVPAAATAPALVVVGIFMAQSAKNINWDDFSIAIPAFLTIAGMAFTYSIAEGIVFGIITYTLINAVLGRFKKVSPLLYVLTALFILRYFLLV